MSHLKWYAVLAVIIIGAYLVVTMQLDDRLTAEHEGRINEQQALQTQLAAQSIEAHFAWVLGTIANIAERGIPARIALANSPDAIEASPNNLLRIVANAAYPEEKLVIQYITHSGEVLADYTQHDLVTAEDLALIPRWLDAYSAEVIRSQTYTVTDITITGTRRLYGILYPVTVTSNADMDGIVVAMLDFNVILDEYIIPVHFSPFGDIWVQDSTSRVVYDHEPEVIDVYVTNLSASYPDLQRVNQKMMTIDTGQDAYHYTDDIGGDVVRKLVAWSTLYLGNQRLTIALAAPASEVNDALNVYRQMMRLVGALLVIVLLVGSGIFNITRHRDLTELVNQRTAQLQQLNSELEQRVTDRTAELTHRNAQLSTILETLEDGVIFRRRNQVIYANPAITRLLGFTSEEIRQDSRLVFNLVKQDLSDAAYLKFQQEFEHAMGQRRVLHEDVILKRKNGDSLYARLYVAGIYDPAGELIGTLEIIHDNSHAIILQQQKDRFITNASHELRRPLSNLKTRLYLLRQQPDDLPKHLEVLERATNDMTDLVRDLVDVAQFTRDVIKLNRQNITLQSTLDASRTLQEMVATRRNVTVTYDLTATPLHLFGDYQRLSQALSNILNHAINATPNGGTVSVAMNSVELDHEHWGIIRIIDQSATTDQNDLQHIFNPFFQPSEGAAQSTGLGLTIAHLIVNQHGGSINAHDHAGGGTLFMLKIPLNALSQPEDQTT